LEFTTTQVLRIFDLNRNGFKDWLARGYIKPSLNVSRRQGEKNLFSLEDLYLIAIFKKMLTLGFSRVEAGRLIEDLRKRPKWADMKKYTYVIYKSWLKDGTVMKSSTLVWSETQRSNIEKRIFSDEKMGEPPDFVGILDMRKIVQHVDSMIKDTSS